MRRFNLLYRIIIPMLTPAKFKVIEPFGEMKYKANEWSGNINGLYPNLNFELNIRVTDFDEDISSKIETIKTWMMDYDLDLSKMYHAIFENYSNTKWAKTQQEIEKMYFLSSITLNNSGSWGIILEPEKNVTSVYKQSFMFTMVDGEIVWMNF